MRNIWRHFFLSCLLSRMRSIDGWISHSSVAKHGPKTITAQLSKARERAKILSLECMQATSTVIMSSSSAAVDAPDLPNLLVPLVAIILLVASQTFINQMLNGDQGLGAYLKDGRGVGKSSFRPLSMDDKSRAVANDPLPWLRLPKLDFVQVAGQEDEDSDAKTSDGDDGGLIDDLQQEGQGRVPKESDRKSFKN